MVLYQSRHDATEYGRLAQLVEHLLDVQEVTGSSPVPSTKQFVLEPDSLRERVRVRFLFTEGSAKGLLGTVNEQRQGITIAVVPCLLFLVFVKKYLSKIASNQFTFSAQFAIMMLTSMYSQIRLRVACL